MLTNVEKAGYTGAISASVRRPQGSEFPCNTAKVLLLR
jgi:hypothetical protein